MNLHTAKRRRLRAVRAGAGHWSIYPTTSWPGSINAAPSVVICRFMGVPVRFADPVQVAAQRCSDWGLNPLAGFKLVERSEHDFSLDQLLGSTRGDVLS